MRANESLTLERAELGCGRDKEVCDAVLNARTRIETELVFSSLAVWDI